MINEDVYPLDFYTQYSQFYLTDGADEDSGGVLWTDTAYYQEWPLIKGF